jgi:hypothetical protein
MANDEMVQFKEELIAQIKNDAVANNEYDQIQFLETITSEMEMFEICPIAISSFFERIGNKKRKLAIHGYNVTDFDNTLHLYYADYTGSSDLSVINFSSFEDCVKKTIAFIEDAISHSIEDSVEVSDPGYELARMIRTDFGTYERIKIYVVSDRIKSERFKNVDDHSACGKQTFAIPIDLSYYHDVIHSRKLNDSTIIETSEFGFDGIEAMEVINIDENYCKSYIGIVPGKFLANIYKKYGSNLLESNVRSFLTVKTGTNKGIKRTIEEQPEMFFAYNNGVAITATEINYDSDKKLIRSFTNLQIVNGGQTTVSLYNFLNTNKISNLDIVSVSMKLSVIKVENSLEIVQNISRYANTQNAVKESDLDSNNEFQKRMEQFSRRILIPRSSELGSRKWYYERIRGQYIQDVSKLTSSEKKSFIIEYAKDRVIDKIAFSKFRYTYELCPHLVSKGGQTCYKKFSDSVENDWDDDKSDKYNENYYKETIAVTILYNAVYREIPKCNWFNGSFRVQVANYTISKLIDMLKKQGYSINMNMIWIDQAVKEPIIEQTMLIGEKFLGYLKEKGNNGENPSQWCKQQKCWEYVQDMSIGLNETILKYCTNLEEVKQISTFAEMQQRSDEDTDALNKIKMYEIMQWTRVRTTGMRKGMSSTESQILSDVIKYLKDPCSISLQPSRAKKALDIKIRYE